MLNKMKSAFGKKTIIVLFLIALTIECRSQVSQEWEQRYNGSGNSVDEASSMAVDAAGNVYVTGYSVGSGTNGDYVTIKYNSAGVQQWVGVYNGPVNGPDEAHSIAVDAAGNVYVAGSSLGNGTGADYLTIKYNSTGVQQWAVRYNGSGNVPDEAYSVAVDAAGNVYVTGKSTGNGTGADYVTIKYNAAGVQQWAQRYNGPGNDVDRTNTIAVDAAGNVYVTGYSVGSGTGDDYATIKYTAAGNIQWIQRYNGPGNNLDRANTIAVDAAGNVYVTGSSTGNGTNTDYATIKYGSTGVPLWIQRYNGPPGDGFDGVRAMAIDAEGNVYVTGHSQEGGVLTDNDYATIKYSSAGVQQWIQRYHGYSTGSNIATSIAVDISGNVYITGESEGLISGRDYATIKYNSTGVQQWIKRYNGPSNGVDGANSMAIDTSGNVYVTGFSTGLGTNIDYQTIKYSQPIGITPISTEVPEGFSLWQNYPNPFNPKTNVRIQMPNSGFVKLAVFDISGKEVAVLVNENLSAGTYNVDFDASHLASGTYFYRLETGSFAEVKKMVLIK